MASNALNVGEGRLGWMADDDPRTPEVATYLVDDGHRITLTVPWPSGHLHSQYQRWFIGAGVHFGDDPDRARYAYKVPEMLWFRDSRGPVALVGCRALTFDQELISGMGQGLAHVRFAVLGGTGDYRRINGLRTELPGLGEWIGLRSVTKTVTAGVDHLLESVTLTARAPHPIPVARRLNLCIRPNWRTSAEVPDATVVRESLLIETLVGTVRSWSDHLRVHNLVRDLLDVATWRPNAYTSLAANLVEDPEATLSGRRVASRWAPVQTRDLRQPRPSPSRARHLFSYADIGVAGVRRWIHLHDRFARGIRPMLGLLDIQGGQIETVIAQSGVAFEALGFQLALDHGKSKTQAGKENHEFRLRRLVTELPHGVLEGSIGTADEWVARSTRAYNGVKHANRIVPDPESLMVTQRENELVFRAWVAHRLGVGTAALQRALADEP